MPIRHCAWSAFSLRDYSRLPIPSMYDPSSDIEDYAEHTRGLPVNSALGLALHPQLEDLRAVLAGSIPYCCGTVALPAENFTLFYGTDEFAR